MATVPKQIPREDRLTKKNRPKVYGRVPSQRPPAAPLGAQVDAGFGYQGGPVIQNPEIYVSFWGRSWNTAANVDTRLNLLQFVQDFISSNYMNILSQYSVGQGAGRCGVYRSQSARTGAAGDFSDADVHTNIQAMIDNGDLPEPGNPANTSLIIFLDDNIRINDTGLGIVMCEPRGDTAFGYHNFFTTRAGHKCYYSVVPALTDACLNNSCPLDSTCSLHTGATQEQRRTQVASHEFSEMVTDPEISAWRNPNSGSENGDNCNGQNNTITVGGRTWTVQLMYSRADDVNNATACVLAPANPIAPIGVPIGTQPQRDTMHAGEVLNPGQFITSANGQFQFIYQTDGNLVLYSNGAPLWATGTNGRGFGSCIMQGDSNLVVYVGGPFAVWASGTNGSGGDHLVMQDDGNAVIYRPNGTPVWATNTWMPIGPTAQGNSMQPGQALFPGQSIRSSNGQFVFIYQTDGNLVLYSNGVALWASGTNGRGVGVCIMQGDGNLVIYKAGGSAIWASGTSGSPRSHLLMQDDGNAVIYRPDGTAIWATNTWTPTGNLARGDTMQPGDVLTPGRSIKSANGQFQFIYQTDGNLVLYSDGAALWASGTTGRGVGVCIMQGDGNLVIYKGGGTPIWASGTSGSAGSHLVLQNDGNAVIYRPNNTAIWATNTSMPTGRAAQGDSMQPGDVLNAGRSITSANGQFRFVYQGDGNLVLYSNGAPLWASGTNGHGVGVCIMQGDGNLVIYKAGGGALWASGTNGSSGSHLVVQNDGNAVIYRPNNTAIWATNTPVPGGAPAQGDSIQPGQVLNPGQSVVSANGHFRFVYQEDGNLVLYSPFVALWASGTNGRGVGVCIMQGDGNLVIYKEGGAAIWASGTSTSPGSHLVMQDDGNAVIYRPDGAAVWATNTV